MAIIIKNACIITCDNNAVIPDGFLEIEDGKIARVGKMSDIGAICAAHGVRREIAAAGRIVMPGFINAHMHLYSQFARGLAVSRMTSFLEVLEGLWWRLDKALVLEDVYYSGLLGLIEAIKAGATTVIDHHASYGCTKGSLLELTKAFNKTGVRGALCYEVSDRHGEKACEEAIAENIDYCSSEGLRHVVQGETENQSLLRSMFGLHASLTLSPATLKKVCRANEKLNLPYHIHTAEGPEDLKDAKKRYKKTVVGRLHDEGILTKGTIAAHCIHVNDKDTALLKKSGAFVVHNPVSNMNNAVGTAPYLDMCEAGVPVGIGTDGMSAGIFADVGAASVLHKKAAGNPQAGWCEVQKSTLDTNPAIASALFGGEIGKLKPGSEADVIIADYIPCTEVNSDNYWGHILFGVINSRIHTTIAAGRVLMEDYKLAGIDEASIIKEASKLSAAVWNRFKKG